MSINKTPESNVAKKPRIPNAFMIFVKEQKNELVKSNPDQNKPVLGSFLGKKWRSMSATEKQVYYDKYSVLKKVQGSSSGVYYIYFKLFFNLKHMFCIKRLGNYICSLIVRQIPSNHFK